MYLVDKINAIVPILSTFSTIAISLTAIIALLSVLFKPVRKFVVWIYKRITKYKDRNEEVIKKINEMEELLTKKIENVESVLSMQIEEVSNRNDENEKDRIRWEVLDFANSCRNGRRHSKEEFVHIFELRTKYERLLKKTGGENGVFEEDYKYILKVYGTNDFLT